MRMLSGVRAFAALFSLVFGALLSLPARVALAQTDASFDPSDTRLAEARKHFELGIAHFDRREWHAALAEFLRSRELAPTRSNTKNAAICLRKVGRFDEALDMFETLLREFPELSAADRELARREIGELGASVGTIELRDAPPGAQVSIDGIDRGTTPLAGPVRLPAGTHTLRVVKEGSLPFEARVDLAGRRAEIVRVRLAALTQAGRLRVTEKSGRTSEVVVDGSRVGTTPWDGALAPGTHSVWLRGGGTLGTPPKSVSIEVGKQLELELAALPLRSQLRVTAVPDGAEVSVDGVPVGRGSWKGRLAPGTHRVDVTFAGYEPFSREVMLADDEWEVVSVTLEPRAPKARIELQLDAGVPLGLLWGGDLQAACQADCRSSLPLGIFAQAHGVYRFSTGLGLGIQAGYLRLWTTLEGRPEILTASLTRTHEGTVDDRLRVAGLLAGAEADYVTGTTWPLTLRVSAGALIGAVTDIRTGTLRDTELERYATSATQRPRASYFYLGPEARIGYRAARHVEVSVGAKLLVLTALARPNWDATLLYYAGENDRGGVFPSASLTGSVMVAVLPGAALRYAF